MSPLHPPVRPERGTSLVEALMALAIAGIVASTVAPSMVELQDRKRLEGAAAELRTELLYARSLAVERQRTVRFGFGQTATQSCYVIHTGGPGACTCSAQGASCAGNAEALRNTSFSTSSRLRVSSNSASLAIDAVQGTVTPTATIELRNSRAQNLKLVINIVGRVRSCTDTGLPGYRAC